MRTWLVAVMAESSEFCQQAVTTANLLLEAASMLESSQGSQGRSLPRSRSPLDRSNPRSWPESEASGSSSAQRPSVSTELRNLFNWNSRGKGKSTKRKLSTSVPKAQKKTRKVLNNKLMY